MEREMDKLTSLLIICCLLSGFIMVTIGCGRKKEEVKLDFIVNIKGPKSYLNAEMVLYVTKQQKKMLKAEQKEAALKEKIIEALSGFHSDKSVDNAKSLILKAINDSNFGLSISGQDLHFTKFVMQ